MNLKNKKVFVGVSGGVDSSVSLAVLKEKGYDVTGVFIKVWYPNWISEGCDWRAERRDAMRVCAELGVPFLTLDLEEVYKKQVVDYLVETYKKGDTPNPDVMCNRHVKFGAFWKFAKENGADFIATGHYAQNIYEDGEYKMIISRDATKDQTYFLYTLTQEDLQHVLFPVGGMEKSEVRKLAEKYNLQTSGKKDSQGLCFLGDITIRDLISQYVAVKEGHVLNIEGDVIGVHDGTIFYTIGQRHGFRLKNNMTDSKAHFVVEKNIEKNTITVSENVEQSLGKITELSLDNITFTTVKPQEGEMECVVRYHGTLLSSNLQLKSNNEAVVSFKENISEHSPAKGQSVVFYKNNMCIGGGIIK